MLLNRVEGYQRPSVWQCLCRDDRDQPPALRDLDNSIVSGFQLATLSGPMCEEPLMGVCFSVERWDVQSSSEKQDGPTSLEAFGGNNVSAQVENAVEGLSQTRRRQDGTSADCYGPVSGQLIAAMKEACRHAFQAQPQRLMAAMYTCEIMATAEVLGMRRRDMDMNISLSGTPVRSCRTCSAHLEHGYMYLGHGPCYVGQFI